MTWTGKQVLNARTKAGLTQAEAAGRCGRSQGWLAQLEARGTEEVPPGSVAALEGLMGKARSRARAECAHCNRDFDVEHGNQRYCAKCSSPVVRRPRRCRRFRRRPGGGPGRPSADERCHACGQPHAEHA